MKTFEIVNKRVEKQRELAQKTAEFNEVKENLLKEISELLIRENQAKEGLDVGKIILAESVIYVHGDPYGKADGVDGAIANLAIVDIAKGCPHLKTSYFGNKRYSGYYQRCDCSYGMGPSHGGIVDEIGLIKEARTRSLTDDEKDACIYYLQNFAKTNAFREKTVSA